MLNNGQVRHLQRRSARPQPQFDGVRLPGRPAKPVPEIPLNLPDVGDQRLMELFTLYTAWANFIDVRRVQAEIEEATAETELKVLDATGLAAGWVDPKESRVTIIRAETKLDPEYAAAQSRFDEAKARRKMLTVLSTNMERGAALLSRELTRRVGRAPIEGRAASANP